MTLRQPCPPGACVCNREQLLEAPGADLRILQLTRQQAAELGNAGIRVNAIAPGPVDTAMAKAVHSAEIRADYHDAIPQGRYGTEDEIANGVWFLASPEASYINGQILAVDGGFEATGIGLTTLRGARR